jgi:hypothetical protein
LGLTVAYWPDYAAGIDRGDGGIGHAESGLRGAVADGLPAANRDHHHRLRRLGPR